MRIMIAGTHSGCGKTTVTCAVLQALKNRGMDVTAFKCGPDYIDPMFHSRVIGAKSRNLDTWLCDKNTVNYLLQKNAGEISVIEGVMGFYDGVNGTASAHALAAGTGTRAVIVIDCKGMSESLGAVMKGFLTYKTPNIIAGFIFNRLPESLEAAAAQMCDELGTQYFGYLPYNAEYSIESRRLGLVAADEIKNLQLKLDILARTADKTLRIDDMIRCANESGSARFSVPMAESFSVPDAKTGVDFSVPVMTGNFSGSAKGACDDFSVPGTMPPRGPIKIAVAYDKAFCFYYEDNFDLLRSLGCEIIKFSPLADKKLPDGISGLIIGGGYPELHAAALSDNTAMLYGIRAKINGGLPTIAECGGFMYLCKTLEGADKRRYDMAGVIDTDAYKTDKLQRFGYVTLTAREDNLLCKRGEKIRSREFHYWNAYDCGSAFTAQRARGGDYVCAHASKTLYAGFPHLHFWANTDTAVNFVNTCGEYARWKE